jgi:hypothetical protein
MAGFAAACFCRLSSPDEPYGGDGMGLIGIDQASVAAAQVPCWKSVSLTHIRRRTPELPGESDLAGSKNLSPVDGSLIHSGDHKRHYSDDRPAQILRYVGSPLKPTSFCLLSSDRLYRVAPPPPVIQ